MAKFVIAPHMRLHEWVARDKGYFQAEGLQCEFQDQLGSPTGRFMAPGWRPLSIAGSRPGRPPRPPAAAYGVAAMGGIAGAALVAIAVALIFAG